MFHRMQTGFSPQSNGWSRRSPSGLSINMGGPGYYPMQPQPLGPVGAFIIVAIIAVIAFAIWKAPAQPANSYYTGGVVVSDVTGTRWLLESGKRMRLPPQMIYAGTVAPIDAVTLAAIPLGPDVVM